jgi:hypothetical protein
MRRPESPDKLTILRREDHFRQWRSLDDERVCDICGKNFTGNEVILSEEGNCFKLHCATVGCRSQVHQWVYPGNPLINNEASADWWKALGNLPENRAEAV